MVREELAKYLNNKPCPECGGTRLRREARSREGRASGEQARAIFEVSGVAAQGARWTFFRRLALDGQKAAIADRDRQRDRQPARSSSTTSASTTWRSTAPAETLSGGESQRIRLASPDRLRPDRRDVRAGRAVDRACTSATTTACSIR